VLSASSSREISASQSSKQLDREFVKFDGFLARHHGVDGLQSGIHAHGIRRSTESMNCSVALSAIDLRRTCLSAVSSLVASIRLSFHFMRTGINATLSHIRCECPIRGSMNQQQQA